MARIVVAGGGIAGLATALAAAEHGHDVVVVEGSPPPPAGPVAEVAAGWQRAAVPQAQHAHTLTSVGVRVLRDRAPRVLEALFDAGAHLLDLTRAAPHPDVPDDPDLVALACRRVVLELVLHRAVAARSDVDIRYGARVRGIAVGPGRRVTAALLDTGPVPADVVVDATGRRTCGRDWLAAVGCTDVRADRVVPTRQVVLGRFYRRPGAHGPLNRGNAAGVVSDHYAGVLHPGDGDHFSVAIGLQPRDPDLAAFREAAVFDAVAAATPAVGAWFDNAHVVPVSEVRVIGSPPNVLGGVATDPTIPVTGLLPVGDAACVTDPIFGRGMSLALTHGTALADLITSTSPSDLTERAAELATTLFQPWYDHAAEVSTERLTRLHTTEPLPNRLAASAGPPSGLWAAEPGGPAAADRRAAESGAPTGIPGAAGLPGVPAAPPSGLRAVGLAAARDAVVWHGLTRVLMGLDRPALFGEPAFAARVRAAVARPGAVPVGPPSRADLLDVVARARRTVPC